MSLYAFDPSWTKERDRLDAQALLLDPGTEALLIRLGVGPGWRCAEIAAGAGSIARWLSARVAPAGRVIATDLDTRFLSAVGNLEVCRHDIVAGPLEPGGFDLVHTRLLLMHLADREQALRHMIASLRPGGLLLVEDYDLGTSGFFHPPSALQARVALGVQVLFEQAGADPRYGLKLLPALLAAGIDDARAEGRMPIVALGSPMAEALALKLEHFQDRLVAGGFVTEADVRAAIAHARTPRNGVHYPPLMVAAWGRRPE